jgi:hypothetical protein
MCLQEPIRVLYARPRIGRNGASRRPTVKPSLMSPATEPTMKPAIAAIALGLSLTAAQAETYNITLECHDRAERLLDTQECTGSRYMCLTAGSREFDRLPTGARRICEVNVARR